MKVTTPKPTTKETVTMNLTTVTIVSVDGVMQGLGSPDEDRRGGFERGGWVGPLFESSPLPRPARTLTRPAEALASMSAVLLMVRDEALARARLSDLLRVQITPAPSLRSEALELPASSC